MKKLYIPLLTLAALCFTELVLAQQTSTKLDSTQKRAQAVYFELLGPGGLYSINYDTRFQKREDGLGLRVGVSYANADQASLFTLPIQLNYLLGKNEKYFEIGAGATYATAQLDLFEDEENDDSGSTVIGTINFGYRKQPKAGGFLFKAGSTIAYGQGFFIPYYGHIAFGYKF